MSQYRFIGIEAEIVGVAKMDRYGQLVTLPDGMDHHAAAACCLPAAEFEEIFEGVAVDAYQMVAAHDGAPKEFQDAKRLAAAALADFKKKANGGGE
jgi:hypothetical protein